MTRSTTCLELSIDGHHTSIDTATLKMAHFGSQFFKGETGRNTRGLVRLIILCFIAGAAVSSRLFSVIRFESIIHECWSLPVCSIDTADSSASRSLVQFQSNKVPSHTWLLQILGLV